MEKQFLEYLGKKLGLTDLVNPKPPKPSKYTKYGKVIPERELYKYQTVGDKFNPDTPEFPNPTTDSGLIPLMLTGTPQDLAIETVATGTGEALGSGTAGAIAGLTTSILTGRPKNIKAQNEVLKYNNNYYGDYKPKSGYNDYKGYQYKEPKNKKAIATLKGLQEPNIVVPQEGLPRLNPDGTVTSLDVADVDNALLEKYGDDALDFFKEGRTYGKFEDGMGYMRGKENLNRMKSNQGELAKYFGRIKAQHMDIDRPDPSHPFDMFVTLDNLGQMEESANRWVAQNPWERALVFMSTPGGGSLIDVGKEGAKSMGSRKSLIDFMNYAKFHNADPAYMNFTVDKRSKEIHDYWKNLPNKLKQDKSLFDYIASPPMARKAGRNPWVAGNWKSLHSGTNPFGKENFNAWAKEPKGLGTVLPFYNDIRLTAKPERMFNYMKNKDFTASGLSPAYTREPLFIVGNDNAINLHALNKVLGPRGLMDYVRQGRYIQGLEDPNNKKLAKGFTDSSYLNSISKELSNKGASKMREFLKLGLIGPAVYDNIMQNEERE